MDKGISKKLHDIALRRAQGVSCWLRDNEFWQRSFLYLTSCASYLIKNKLAIVQNKNPYFFFVNQLLFSNNCVTHTVLTRNYARVNIQGTSKNPTIIQKGIIIF